MTPEAYPGGAPSSDHTGGRPERGAGFPPPRSSRFLDDAAEEDFDESTSPEYQRPRFVRTIAFYCLMALIGSGAAAIGHYYGPDLTIPASANDVEKLTTDVRRLTEEQGKFTQTIKALQLAQDALQKTLAGREQELQRLSAENHALKADLDALRSVAATSAPHPAVAPKPKHPASPPPAKKNAAAKADADHAPLAVSPQH